MTRDSVVVVGSGMMGHGISAMSAVADPAAARKAESV